MRRRVHVTNSLDLENNQFNAHGQSLQSAVRDTVACDGAFKLNSVLSEACIPV